MTARDFRSYFEELHGRPPFPWQEELARRVCEEDWPDVIDLPTGCGKTACIDIALFALAARQRAPRRIFFVVDRRVIVDEAHQRMVRIQNALRKAETGTLGEVASRLRAVAGGNKPVRVAELRGGIYRDVSWVRDPLQPLLVASTVDQVGSRLLFRGYGVSDRTLPIHAAMVGNDALILLDEAHCSRAFAKTLERVERYRGNRWASEPLEAPFRFVEMTATPARTFVGAPLALGDEDRANPALQRRLAARKRVRVVTSRAKSGDAAKLAADLIREAEVELQNPRVRRVAVMVNRVATAKAVAEKWKQRRPQLVIGRMRPVDRDAEQERLSRLHSETPRTENDAVQCVVATQCLEVGADLDFDAIVTECASIDALLQRFGRLDRLGNFGEGRGCIVLPAVEKRPDAVYGEALQKTREWLEGLAGTSGELEFGIEGDGERQTVRELWKAEPADRKDAMRSPEKPAPALLPSHLDALVQTSPRPEPEPEVALFLHGKEAAEADVQVVWRADLDEASEEKWKDIVKLCPPVAAEGLPVPLWVFRKWACGSDEDMVQSDVEGVEEPEQPRRRRMDLQWPVLLWRGKESMMARDAAKIRPGETVVLAETRRGHDVLGYIPEGRELDAADEAFWRGRQRARVRLHEKLGNKALLLKVTAADGNWAETREAFAGYRESGLAGDAPGWWRRAVDAIAGGARRDFIVTEYPTRDGWVIEERTRKLDEEELEEDGDEDEASVGSGVLLEEHTRHVREEAERIAAATVSAELCAVIREAAEVHDLGKADERFQALLHGGDSFAARFAPKPLAKGRFVPRSQAEQHWEASGLPDGFRHELVSLAALGGEDGGDLLRHLVASHHGRCRPFAPVVLDDHAEAVSFGHWTVSAEGRRTQAAHRLENGVADRFWMLTRRYGWWGLAYLESLLRLADWKASDEEQRGKR